MKILQIFFVLMFASVYMTGQILQIKTDTLMVTDDELQFSVDGFRGTIQWQFSEDGELWYDLGGETNMTLSVPSVGRFGYYRAKVIDTYCIPTYSDVAQLISVFPTVQTLSVVGVTQTEAELSANVIMNGAYSQFFTSGFIWGQINDEGQQLIAENSAGAISESLTDLLPGTEYFVQAFSTNGDSIFLGNKVTFSTDVATPAVLANVTTRAANAVTESEANLRGMLVLVDTESEITDRGFYFSLSSMPNEADNAVSAGSGEGYFNSLINGLEAETTYYFIAYATDGDTVVLGEVMSFTTETAPVETTVATATVSAITDNSVTVTSEVTGEAAIEESGFYYSTTNTNPTANDNTFVSSNTDGTFSGSLTGLVAETTYYIVAYVVDEDGSVTTSEPIEFTTAAEPVETTVATATVSAITDNSVTVTSEVTGEAAIEESGFYYSTTNTNPTANDNTLVSSETNGIFSGSLTGLVAETTYYIVAYVVDEDGTVTTSEPIEFTTESEFVETAVTYNSTSAIEARLATLNASVVFDESTSIISTGFYWSASSQNPGPNDNTALAVLAEGVFSADITALEPNTSYYVVAFATDAENMTVQSEVVSFKTPELVLTPSVLTLATTAVNVSTATLNGEVVADEAGDAVTETGFYWSQTNTNPTADDNIQIVGSGSGTFYYELSGLSASTTYYVVAYAIDADETVVGEVIEFTTSEEVISTPTVTTLDASDILTTSATLNALVANDEAGASVAETGFYWSATNSDPTADDNILVAGNGAGKYSALLDGLESGITYYVVAYATDADETVTGGVIEFTTFIETAVAYDSTSALSETGASLNASVVFDPSETITSAGFYWSETNTDPDGNDNAANAALVDGLFIAQLTGLKPNTTYYVRAFVSDASGNQFQADVSSFTTAPLQLTPTVTTLDATDILETSALLNATVTDGEAGAAVIERGFYWSAVNTSPTADDNILVVGKGAGDYSILLENLDVSTTYYVVAYATDEDETVTGEVVEFKTSDKITYTPTVTTLDATEILKTSALLNATVTDDEAGATVIERGFYWSATNASPTADDNILVVGDGAGDYSILLENLDVSTTYYVVAYATDEDETVTGDVISFTTEAAFVITELVNGEVSNITQSSFTLSATVLVDSTTSLECVGFYSSTTSTAPGSRDVINYAELVDGEMVLTLTGLTPNTTYYIQAFVMEVCNDRNTRTEAPEVITVTTAAETPLPVVTTADATGVNVGSAVLNGTIADDEAGATVIEKGFFWSSVNQQPVSTDNKVIAGSGAGSFSSAVGNLSAATTYYYRAYATVDGTNYVLGTVLSFTTPAEFVMDVTLATADAGEVGENSAILNANVTVNDGETAIVSRGFFISMSNEPSAADTEITSGSGEGDFSETASSLTAETVYYYRAYAETADSVILGNVVSFTTLVSTAPVTAVATLAASGIDTESASLNAEATVSESETIVARGFYWSISSTEPTSADEIIDAGSGEGLFTGDIAGLQINTTVYYRAFINNGTEEILGEVMECKTASSEIIYINLENTTASATSSTVLIEDAVITITEGGIYNVSGTLDDGELIVNSTDTINVKIILDGASITSTESAAIFVQNAENVKLFLEEGTTNTIVDAETYVYADASVTEPSAAIFSKDDITVTGTGTLNVTANYNDGIASNDEVRINSGIITITSADDAIVGKDDVEIKGGTITLEAGGNGIKATNDVDGTVGFVYVEAGTISINSGDDAISAESYVEIAGGEIAINSAEDGINSSGLITVADGTINIKNAGEEGMNADSTLSVNGGSITVVSALNGITSSDDIVITGGTFNLTVGGGNTAEITDTLSHNGIDASDDLTISNASITINAAGDGLNSNDVITIESGIFDFIVGDDGIKANDGVIINGGTITVTSDDIAISCDTDITITGGDITTESTASDAINADGNVSLTGGTLDLTVADDGIKATDISIEGGSVEISVSGDGGKGLKSSGTISLCGGDISIYTTGGLVLDATDASYCSAIKSVGDITICGATIVIDATGIAGKGITCDANIYMLSGSVDVSCTGADNGDYGATCMKADNNIDILSGTLTLYKYSTGSAGKALSANNVITFGNDTEGAIVNITTEPEATASTGGGGWGGMGGGASLAGGKAVKGDNGVIVNNGEITISTGNDGIKSDVEIIFNGGKTTILKSFEGVESLLIQVNGGYLYATASDDAVNATAGGDQMRDDGSMFKMEGGVAIIHQESGDALDSNGGAQLNGGKLIIFGSGAAGSGGGGEGAIDVNATTYFNGTMCAVVGSSTGSLGGTYTTNNTSFSAGDMVTVSSGNEKIIFQSPMNASAMYVSPTGVTVSVGALDGLTEVIKTYFE